MPVTPSPAVKRAARLLKLLAAAPRTAFTLSELARGVGISRASCQTLVLALSSSGLIVRRDGGPTYKLGLELVALGEAAKMSTDVVALAEGELRPLGAKFRACGMAGAVSGADIVIFAAISPPHPLGYSVAAGSRLSFRAPVGLIYLARATEAEVEAWLAAAAPPLSKARKDQIIKDLANIRARGWSASTRMIAARDPDLLTVHEATAREFKMERVNVVGISAPVVDLSGKMVCALALTAFPAPLSGSQIYETAAAVKAAADSMTRQLGGMPSTAPSGQGRTGGRGRAVRAKFSGLPHVGNA